MNFWKTFGASLLAFVVAAVIVVVGSISFLFNILLSLNVESEGVPAQSVLYINIAEDITDAPPASAFGALDPSTMTFNTPITLLQALTAIENAANDENIKGAQDAQMHHRKAIRLGFRVAESSALFGYNRSYHTAVQEARLL